MEKNLEKSRRALNKAEQLFKNIKNTKVSRMRLNSLEQA